MLVSKKHAAIRINENTRPIEMSIGRMRSCLANSEGRIGVQRPDSHARSRRKRRKKPSAAGRNREDKPFRKQLANEPQRNLPPRRSFAAFSRQTDNRGKTDCNRAYRPQLSCVPPRPMRFRNQQEIESAEPPDQPPCVARSRGRSPPRSHGRPAMPSGAGHWRSWECGVSCLTD